MLKKIVGSITVVTVMVCALGMGYPQENETQAENVTVAETLEKEDAVSWTGTTQKDAIQVQEQGTEAISQLADGEAVIQDSTIPLVESIVESNKRKTTLTDEELILLQKVVSAEARGESAQAQYYVACVILNRLESPVFPNSLEAVVNQSGQFSCVESGAILNVPITESVVESVAKALEDNTLDANVLWFRSDYYHPFHKNAFHNGRMFFSTI